MADYKRGQIWQVDFDPQRGSEIKKIRPALILSANEFNSISDFLGLLIVIPGTSTRVENPRTGKLVSGYVEVLATQMNGLKNTTYFIPHLVKSVSIHRMKSHIGMIENHHRKYISSVVATILGLYEDLGEV